MNQMDSTAKIRRHGYHLMSLASIGQIVCFGLLIWNLRMRSWDPERAALINDPSPWTAIAQFAVAIWLAQAWTPVQLRPTRPRHTRTDERRVGKGGGRTGRSP